jgi:hypothetical protein
MYQYIFLAKNAGAMKLDDVTRDRMKEIYEKLRTEYPDGRFPEALAFGESA